MADNQPSQKQRELFPVSSEESATLPGTADASIGDSSITKLNEIAEPHEVSFGRFAELSDIIAEIDRCYEEELPVEAIRAAQQRKEEIVPALIDLIERGIQAIQAGAELEELTDGPLIALYLLWEFRAKQAVPTIHKALSLPEDKSDWLFGRNESYVDLPSLLATLFGGHLDLIDDLICNLSIETYIRVDIVVTYSVCVKIGILTREQAIARQGELFRRAIASGDSETVSMILSEMIWLFPHELQEDIERAFDLELVQEDWLLQEDALDHMEFDQFDYEDELQEIRYTELTDAVEVLFDCYRTYSDDDEDDDDDDDDDDDGFDADLANDYREIKRWAEVQMLLDHIIAREERLLTDEGNQEDEAESPQLSHWTEPIRTRSEQPRVGRNDPCPCGSGKKYKKCCWSQEE